MPARDPLAPERQSPAGICCSVLARRTGLTLRFGVRQRRVAGNLVQISESPSLLPPAEEWGARGNCNFKVRVSPFRYQSLASQEGLHRKISSGLPPHRPREVRSGEAGSSLNTFSSPCLSPTLLISQALTSPFPLLLGLISWIAQHVRSNQPHSL